LKYSELTGTAQQGLAIVTCMDSRINPLSVVGMKSGDAKILRNAGARVTDDVLRTLVLATYLLGVQRILIMPHTNCRMAQVDDVEIHREIDTKYGIDTSEIEFKTVADQRQALIEDVQKVRSYRLLNKDVVVGGAIYDVATGKITPIDC
jgi:carbonic anhydrase